MKFIWKEPWKTRNFKGDASRLILAVARMAIRARLVLLVGVYEWIVWRFEGQHQRVEPRQILESAWCGTVDPRYLKFFELNKSEWQGPVQGPLWWALTYLEQGFHKAEDDTYDALQYLYLMNLHVQPAPAIFIRWVQSTMNRFVSQFPFSKSEDFNDLFNEHIGEYLGDYIGRAALDPKQTLNTRGARTFLSTQLKETRRRKNPFLATPADLADLNFVGIPYTIP